MRKAITEFIIQTFQQQGFFQAVIGVSGGVDSATSLCLLTEALGPENIFPLLMPYGDLYPQSVTDAILVLDYCQILQKNREIINIKPVVDSFYPKEETVDVVRRGNAMARVRMTFLFDRAKKHNALVVGTENKTEHYLGYFTRFGDEASDLEPLRNLYKTEVYQLAKELGVPDVIINKPPTAALWEGQTDENEFSFSYHDADQVLRMYIDHQKTEAEIVASGVAETVIKKVLERVRENSFKHKLPYVIS